MITDRKIDTWTSPVSSEADRPNRSAADMKAIFDANSNQLKGALNGLIDDLGDGAAAMAFTQAAARANIATGDSLATILGKLAKFYADAQTAVNTVAIDALHPDRYLSADGSYSVPSVGEAANGLPDSGTAGNLLVKSSSADYDAEWRSVAPSDIGAAPAAVGVEFTVYASSASWAESGTGYAQVCQANGVTATSKVIVCPSASAFAMWGDCSMRAIELGANSITVYAEQIPTTNLTANALIVG